MTADEKNILIAGGAGFLGSHLADYYAVNNYQVFIVDNLSTGRQENIKQLLKHPNVKFLYHDICNPLPKDYYDPKKQKFDIVANLASPASPPRYQRLALETLAVGSQGTFNLLGLATAHQARFFHASTSEVYGDPDVHPQPETYKGSVNCYGPRSMYDEAKRYAEALIYSYRKKGGTNTCIARFFNTYGPRMDPNDGRVVSNLIVQALQNKPLTIFGHGNQTRSFCYVSDLINGIVKLIDSDVSEPVNLGNPGEFTILELADLVKKLAKSKSKLTHKPMPGDDPLQRQPDISKVYQLLGWRPTVTLKEGLLPTIDYFKWELKQAS